MSKPVRHRPHSIVESAMARSAASKPAPPPARPGDLPTQWRGKRHAEASSPAPAAPVPPALAGNTLRFPAPTNAAGAAPSSDQLAPARRGALVASHLLAAAIGAAVMASLSGPGADAVRPADGMAPQSLAPTAPALAPAVPPAVVNDLAIEAGVRDMLERWRQAWSKRAVDRYLGFYSMDFVPADGTPRSAWADTRRRKLHGQSDIDVQLRDIRLSPLPNGRVEVTLLQDYRSDRYREAGRAKTFLLAREGGEWRILRERQQGG